MFILQIKIQDAVNLLKSTITKLSEITRSKKLPEKDKDKREVRSDEFVPDLQETSSIKSLKELILLLIAFITKELGPHLALQGNMSSKLASNSFTLPLAHTLTQVFKLLSIAKNQNFPDEVRAIAASLVNDALSHMKQQNVDGETAKVLLSLISGAPDDVRGLLYSALKDARKIEENSRRESNQIRGTVNQNLTLATA